MYKVFLSLILTFSTSYSHAFHTTVSSLELQTDDGQELNFLISANNLIPGSMSFMSVSLQTDLSEGDQTQIFIEGVDYGSYGLDSLGTYNIKKVNETAYTMNTDFFLNPQSTINFLSDGILDVDVRLPENSLVDQGRSLSGIAPYVNVDYTYNSFINSRVVPIPASLFLFLSSLLSLMAVRKKI